MKILIPLIDGFEEIEAVAVVDVLRRANLNVVTAGMPGTMITGNSGVKVMADRKLDDIDPEGFQAIILPGGRGAAAMGKSGKLMGIIKDFDSKDKLVAAICFSPVLLAKSGILDNRRATAYPGNERKLPKPRGERVVVDGNIITSQGPGTAMEFALKIVEVLAGRTKAESLKRSLVCR